MAQQELTDVMAAVAARVKKVQGINDVDMHRPSTLRNLPRAVLFYLDSPWELSTGGRNAIEHTIQIDVIVAPLSDDRRARQQALGFIRDVKAVLFDPAEGGLELIPSPNQTFVGPRGSQALRNVIYDENAYLAGIVIIRAIEITGETL